MHTPVPVLTDYDITDDHIDDWLHADEDQIPDDEGFQFDSLDDFEEVDPFGSTGFDFG